MGKLKTAARSLGVTIGPISGVQATSWPIHYLPFMRPDFAAVLVLAITSRRLGSRSALALPYGKE